MHQARGPAAQAPGCARHGGLGAGRVLVLAALLGAAALQAAERAIDKEVLVAADVDAVWAAWTTRDGIVGFFAPDAKVDARVGGA